MGVKTYFFDTYAFYELIEGNHSYEEFSEGVAIVSTRLNLMELYYGLLTKQGQESAEKYYDRLIEFCIEFDDEVVKKAMEFRSLNKKKKLSYVDCIGYILAKSVGIEFLTGNKEFEGLENVKFVK